MTGKQYLMGIAGGALLGGSVNGITALANGRSFWSGNLPNPKPTLPDLSGLAKPEIKQPELQSPKQTPLQSIEPENSFSITTTERPQMLPLEGQGLSISPPRPEIAGYNPDVLTKTGLSHRFPYSFDEIIIKGGEFSITSKGNYWYVAPGSINTGNGWYSVGMYPNGTVFHRSFSNYYPFAK